MVVSKTGILKCELHSGGIKNKINTEMIMQTGTEILSCKVIAKDTF